MDTNDKLNKLNKLNKLHNKLNNKLHQPPPLVVEESQVGLPYRSDYYNAVGLHTPDNTSDTPDTPDTPDTVATVVF